VLHFLYFHRRKLTWHRFCVSTGAPSVVDLGWEAWSELWGVSEWLIGVSWWDDDLLTSRGPPTNRAVPRAMWDDRSGVADCARDLSYPPVGFKCVKLLSPRPVCGRNLVPAFEVAPVGRQDPGTVHTYVAFELRHAVPCSQMLLPCIR
jgi:hypothetical protein